MLVHTVFFWLKEGLSEDEKYEFKKGLDTLKSIPCLGPVLTGSHAPTATRPVIDDSYDFGLTCVFNDVAEHDTYQAHEVHQKFIAENSRFWKTLKVYDFN